MRRALMLLVTATLCLSACSGGPSSATQTPTRTADIKRSTLDIAYSAFVDEDVHHITSKRALEAALEAARVEARAQGSKVEVRTPSFQDTDETQLSDFKLFAEARPLVSVTCNWQLPGCARGGVTCVCKWSDVNGIPRS